MDHEFKCILNAMIFAVALNLILPVLVGYLPLDKSNEYMKMLAHHKMTNVVTVNRKEPKITAQPRYSAVFKSKPIALSQIKCRKPPKR